MCFTYLWLTDLTSEKIIEFQKEYKSSTDAYMSLFDIYEDHEFTLSELNRGYFKALKKEVTSQYEIDYAVK